MRSSAGLDSVLDKIRTWGPSTLLWGCPWRHMFTQRRGIRRKIEEQSRDFRLITRNYKLVADTIRGKGGNIAMEWCMGVEQWKDKLVKKLFNGLGLTPIEVNGCSLGLCNDLNEPVNRKWVIYTDCQEVRDAFRGCACPGTAEHPHHGQNTGSTPLDHYTWQFLDLLHIAFKDNALEHTR